MQEVRAAAMPRSRPRAAHLFSRVPLAMAAATLLTGLFASGSVSAQDRFPWEDYDKRVKASQAVAPLGPDLLGDSVSLSNGALSFTATDVSIPGNSALPVAFTRTYSVTDRKDMRTDEMLADWKVDLPSISGTFAPNWITRGSTTQRCTDTQAPPMPSGAHFLTEFWHGIHINIPGRGSNELLVTNPGTATGGGDTGDGGGGTGPGPGGPGGPGDDDPQRVQHKGSPQLMTTASTMAVSPPTDGATYRWATNDHVQVSCLPSIKNGTGEGFLAVAPDGTRYWFDWMGQNFLPSLESPVAVQGISATNFVPRRQNVLYATRVEDRFGNWVTYTYSNTWNQPGRLTKILASDGRQLTVGYGANGFISSVSDGTRSWQYAYAGANAGRTTLTRVTQPDNSKWTINFAGFTNAEIQNHEYFTPGEIYRTCVMLETPINFDAHPVASITHPSGATGTFTIGIKEHGRSNVPVSCGNVTTDVPQWGNDPNDDINTYVISYNAWTLEKKTLNPPSPGAAAMTWSYTYAPGISKHFYPGVTRQWPVCMESYCSKPPCTSDACAGASYTTVAGPDNTWARYKYGNSFLYNEGKLLRVDRGSDATNILQTSVNTYDLSLLDQTYPASFGDSIQVNGQGFQAEFHRPLTQSQITQQGETFTHTINTFDALARAEVATNASSIGFSRTETTEYHDDPDDWVIGQVRKQLVNTTVVSETLYDSLARPTQQYSFGKLQHTLGYYPDGTLATYKDGRNNITTLSSWYRGVPRMIQYPDGTSESATVNATGMIASTTDENGFTTGYAHDAMGRLTRIDYPTGDTTAWNDWNSNFRPVTAADWKPAGVAAGQWRRMEWYGGYRKITYFDHLWRPVVVDEYDVSDTPGTLRVTNFAYDHAGRTTFASYPHWTFGSLTGVRTTYDALGRATKVVQNSELGNLVTTTTYPTSAFQTIVTNPRGFQTHTTIYQAYDQPSYDLPRGIGHAGTAYTEIHRDVFGKPNWIKRRNGNSSEVAIRNYYYDVHQQLCKQVEPETGATLMGYDAAGNLAWSAAGMPASAPCEQGGSLAVLGRKSVRGYDARNRPISLAFPDGLGDTTTTYTPDGLPEAITAYNGSNVVTTTYTYNKRRMLELERMTWNTINWPIDYAYDANGHLASQASHGVTVSYAPNALGQPTQAGAYASNVSYFPNGALKQFTYGNGIVHTLTQNARGLPERSRDAYGSTAYLDDTYYYDPNGNVAAITDAATGRNQRGNRDMTYDGLDRLTQAVSPMFGTATYAYDALDNLTRATIGGATPRDYWYCYDGSNRLTNIKTSSCSGSTVIGLGYDVQGNLRNKNGATYTFDFGNRLRASDAGPGVSYVYDGLGRRVRDAVSGQGNKYSLYSQSGQLVLVSDGHAKEVQDYVYLAGSLLAVRIRDTTTNIHRTEYYHTDALGSPVALTNASRQVVKWKEYEPYGKLVNAANDDRPGYTGHVMDESSGLIYMQQRYYDPGIGAFLSVDPVAVNTTSGWNFCRYCYAANNPYKFKDPDGRIINFVVGFAIGAGLETAKQVFVDGKSLRDVDVGDVLVAGAVSAIIPGLGNVAKVGYQGAKVAVPAAKAVAKVAGKTANTANRAAKHSATIARNVDKIEGVVADVGKAAGVAVAHQVVKAQAQSSTPETTASDVREAIKPPPPPPQVDKRL